MDSLNKSQDYPHKCRCVPTRLLHQASNHMDLRNMRQSAQDGEHQKLLRPACATGPQSTQCFADDQGMTSSLPKLWSSNEANLLRGDCLKMSVPNIRCLHFCSIQVCQQRNNLHALQGHKSFGGAVMWPPATKRAFCLRSCLQSKTK